MRCIDKRKLIYVLLICIVMLAITGCEEDTTAYVNEYEKTNYNQSLYQGELFATDLCVTDTDVSMNGYTPDSSLTAAGLYDLSTQTILYSQNMFQHIYPASTTKVLTAYVALKYGNLDDVVTVSENALNLGDIEATTCGLQPGDRLTLNDLLHGLILFSGNEAAIAIAEHVSGSVDEFVALMNKEALRLGASQSHFCNPHGLHDPEHYTTGYDLYLIFNACIQDSRFVEMISLESYTATVTNAANEVRELTWMPTNYYSLGLIPVPEGATILGGKTGTTDEAGCCVILYCMDQDENPFITVAMGASDRDILYTNTTSMIQTGIINQ